jgi:ACS family glucarate transporter-like MFS transporter
MTEGKPLPLSLPATETASNGIAANEPPLAPIESALTTKDEPPARSGQKPTNVRYTVLAWACSLSMLTYIDRVCIKQVGADMQADLGLSKQDFGWLFSAFGLAYAMFEVPSGWLGDRFGPRQVLCRIVLWWSLFTALTGCVWKFHYSLGVVPMPGFLADYFSPIPLAFSSLVLLVIIRFLFGAGEAGAYPNTARALRNWFPYTRRGLAQGLLWTFGRWGGAIAPVLITVFALPFGWRGAFIAFGVVGFIWVILFAYYFHNSPKEHPDVNDAERAFIQEKGDDQPRLPLSWGTMLRSPTLWCLSGMYFFSNAGWCFFITWDVEYYKTVLNLDGGMLVLASGAPLFFGGVACLSGGFITDRQVRVWGPRWGRTLQGSVAYALGGTFFLLALVAGHPLLSVASLCIASFFKDFAMAVSWSTCIDVGHRYSGTVSGFMNMVGNLGTFVAPPIIAYLAKDRGDWGLALVFSASVFFLASICWLFINPRHVIVYGESDHAKLRSQGVLE